MADQFQQGHCPTAARLDTCLAVHAALGPFVHKLMLAVAVADIAAAVAVVAVLTEPVFRLSSFDNQETGLKIVLNKKLLEKILSFSYKPQLFIVVAAAFTGSDSGEFI